MKRFEEMSASEVKEVVKKTYVAMLSNNVFQAVKPNVPEMLYAISREWFMNISRGHLSPIDNHLQDQIIFCSKVLNELRNTGTYYKLSNEEN